MPRTNLPYPSTTARRRPTLLRSLLPGATAALLFAPFGGAAVLGALSAPAVARAQAPADKVAKVRVRVYLAELRCPRTRRGGDPNYKAEPYFSAVFQAAEELPNFTVAPPLSIEPPVVHQYPGGVVLLDAVVAPGAGVRGGLNFNESDGDHDWGQKDLERTLAGAHGRVLQGVARLGKDRRLTAQELQSLAVSSFPSGGASPVGFDLDSEDHVGDWALEYGADGPRTQDQVLKAYKKGAYNYEVVLRVERQPLREDGTPILGPAAPPPAGTPDTGAMAGGDLRAIGDSGFAARVDRVRHGASVNDPNVAVTVTYRNITPFARVLRPSMLVLALGKKGARENQYWEGKVLQWPGPGNAPQGAVAPGESIAPDGLCTVIYRFPVAETAQADIERLVIHEPKIGAPQVAFALPRYRPATTPPRQEPPAGAVKNLRSLAGRYRTSEDTVVTVRVQEKFLTFTGVTDASYSTPYPDQAETVSLELQADGHSLQGLWQNRSKGEGQPKYQGRVRLTFSLDGKTFQGTMQPSNGAAAFEYTGVRMDGEAVADKDGFTRIDPTFSVMLARVSRPRPNLLEVVLNVKNVTNRAERLSASSLKLTAEAAEPGAAQFPSTGNLYHPESNPPALLPSDPTVLPGEFARVRYLIEDVPEAVTSFGRLQVRGYGEPRWFDISGIHLAPPADAAGSLSLKFYDFSVEKMEREAKTGEWQMILTIRNSYAARLGVTASVFHVSLLDADGIAIRSDGNLYRASVEGREPVPGTLWIEPNESVRVRVHFAGSRSVAPTQFRIYDGLTKTAPVPAGWLAGQ